VSLHVVLNKTIAQLHEKQAAIFPTLSLKEIEEQYTVAMLLEITL
jgi:hypothetical protein